MAFALERKWSNRAKEDGPLGPNLPHGKEAQRKNGVEETAMGLSPNGNKLSVLNYVNTSVHHITVVTNYVKCYNNIQRLIWFWNHIAGHSWFTLVMNTLIALMGIGFQVTISKSEVQMTSNLFSLV